MSKATTGLTDKASTGFLWTMLQFLFSRSSSLISQLILAYFLVPGEFGLVGLAYTVTAFAGLLQKFGIPDVLIHRQKRFHQWENAGFWLSILVGIVSAIIMLAAAPLAAWFYEEPKLAGVIASLSVFVFFQSICAVPTARLRSRMQFRLIAMINTVIAIVVMVLSIVLAWRGMGAYAIIVPQILASIIRFVWFMAQAGLSIRLTMHTKRWKYLIGNASILLVTYLVITFTSHGDYIILGRLYDADVVGMYYFAFNLSAQAFAMLALNLSNVLFPTLAQLRTEPKRQVDAFFRAACTLVAIGLPICFMQAALADCVVPILFGEKWYPSIPLLAILSLGMGFRIVALPVTSLLKSQGRFVAQLYFFSVAATIFMVAVWFGARWEALGVSIAVSVYSACMGVGALTLSMSRFPGAFGRAIRVYAGPVAAATIAYLPTWYLGSLIPDSPFVNWARLVLIVVVGTGLYYVAARLLFPRTFREIHERSGWLLQKVFKKLGSPARA